MSESFRRLCDDAPAALVGEDGWPVPLPAAIGEALRRALAAYDPAPDVLEQCAANITAAAVLGEAEEKAVLTRAEIAKARVDLERLGALAQTLGEHIRKMGAPAVEALRALGIDADRLLDDAIEAEDAASRAADRLAPSRGGRPPKHAAADVTFAAAMAFRRITGRRPTFSTDPRTGLVRPGEWPDTLRAILEAAGIDASVGAQVNALQRDLPKGAGLSEKARPWEE